MRIIDTNLRSMRFILVLKLNKTFMTDVHIESAALNMYLMHSEAAGSKLVTAKNQIDEKDYLSPAGGAEALLHFLTDLARRLWFSDRFRRGFKSENLWIRINWPRPPLHLQSEWIVKKTNKKKHKKKWKRERAGCWTPKIITNQM